MESLIEVEDFPGRLLHQAALWDNAELLEDLLNGEELACIDAPDSWGRTALHAAATNEDSRCLRILTQSGAGLDSVCGPRGEGRTPLHIAAEHGHRNNVQVLVEAGANLAIKDYLGLTPLDLAEKNDHPGCMQLLRAAAQRQEQQRVETLKLLQDACSQGDMLAFKSVLGSLESPAAVIINFAPNGANTLLFKAAEGGHKDLVSYLITAGADGRVHPVTKYSPLFIAAYNGKKDTAEVLLRRYPDLINMLTVEKWSPLHAACINGHADLVEFFLKFNGYPMGQYHEIVDKQSQLQYRVPFNLNLRDVTGQTVLYLACCLNNFKIVEHLLNYKVRAKKLPFKQGTGPGVAKKVAGSKDDQGETALQAKTTTETAATEGSKSGRSRTVSSIQALISRLRGSATASSAVSSAISAEPLGPDEEWISPLDLDIYCNNGTETALQHAVKEGGHAIAHRLLAAGANPNLIIYTTEEDPEGAAAATAKVNIDDESSGGHHKVVVSRPECYSSSSFKGSTCLVEACRNRDMGMIDLLLKHGARDDDCKALKVVASTKDDVIVSKLLALKANQDPENGVNRKGIAEVINGHNCSSLSSPASLSFASSSFPTTSVMINWHQQGSSGGDEGGTTGTQGSSWRSSSCLNYLREQWLMDASVRLNPKLKLNPRNQVASLHAITRLDVSCNNLSEVPACLFQMQSLKFLSLAQNKLEALPTTTTVVEVEVDHQGFVDPKFIIRQSNKRNVVKTGGWSCPWLEELHLQFNRLLFLPSEMFTTLPSLATLDASNNKLEILPLEIWKSPKLKELNLAFNMLSELPYLAEEVVAATTSSQISFGLLPSSEEPQPPTSSVSSSSFSSSSEDRGGESEQLFGSQSDSRSLSFYPGPGVSLPVSVVKGVPTEVRRHNLKHHSLWSTNVDVQEKSMPVNYFQQRPLTTAQDSMVPPGTSSSSATATSGPRPGEGRRRRSQSKKDQPSPLTIVEPIVESDLQVLNLAHNSFSVVPKCLACLAPSLTRLNLSFNDISKAGSASSYPANLKHLDLSHNQIDSWLVEATPAGSSCSSCHWKTHFNNTLCYSIRLSQCLLRSKGGDLHDDDLLSSTKTAGDGLQQKHLVTSAASLTSSGSIGSTSAPSLKKASSSSCSVSKTCCCVHKRHTRMESLRTLILSDNKLDHINVYASRIVGCHRRHHDDRSSFGAPEEDHGSNQSGKKGSASLKKSGSGTSAGTSSSRKISRGSSASSSSSVMGPLDHHGQLENKPGGDFPSKKVTVPKVVVFPMLSMLDVSNNLISEVPSNISELTNLSVLNLSGNLRVSDLPPQMGMLQKLWNLNTRGCSLQEPLLTMMNNSSKGFKTSDVVGYLRSILENSKSYAHLKLMVVGIQGVGKTSLLDILRQETGSSASAFLRRKPLGVGVAGGVAGSGGGNSGSVDHWAKRMGNKNINPTGCGVSLSTVGIDIGDWTFEKKLIKGQQHQHHHGHGASASSSVHGPVVFRTWDFGGQTEYYATHQYFLSKRSLYLVVWKITDGERGMNKIHQWLINIQARAPNSPVIIVGTHCDVVRDEFPPSFSDYLQQRIREKFINVTDPEKCGLPRVLETVEVSCKSRENMRMLAHLLYDTAFSLRTPGSSTRLLEQKIPATYLALEEVIATITADLKAKERDPVLSQIQYETLVSHELAAKFNGMKFRDKMELNQATRFLHENGLLLHYDDATLKDLYFLDPQWLCDLLSHVVTIREINPFAKNGVMRLDDLRLVFKSSTSISLSAKSYIVSLLNKFEVALTWDSRTLLIPSLLPTEQQLRPGGGLGCDLRVSSVPVRSRGWGVFRQGRRLQMTSMTFDFPGDSSAADDNNFALSNPSASVTRSSVSQVKATHQSSRSRSVPGRNLLRTTRDISKPIKIVDDVEVSAGKKRASYELTHRREMEYVLVRLVLMSYFPSGFWSRLLTRILADDAVVDVIGNYFLVPDGIQQVPCLKRVFAENKPEWICWQTGLELRYMGVTMFCVKQVLPKVSCNLFDYHSLKMALFQADWAPTSWTDLEIESILEVSLPQDTVVIKCPIKEDDDDDTKNSVLHNTNPSTTNPSIPSSRKDKTTEDYYQALVLDPNPKAVCQLLALAVEHIDTLLEDWYPSLGTRFLHTSEGKMLVTRMVPCPRCLVLQKDRAQSRANQKSLQDWKVAFGAPQLLPQTPRVSQESAASCDSGMGQESPRGSVGSSYAANNKPGAVADDKVYSFVVEECILLAFEGKSPRCPLHGDLALGQVAPDTVFLDLDESLRVPNESITRGRLIGRGAFGFVYESVVHHHHGQQPRAAGAGAASGAALLPRNVAVKMLQPMHPGPGASENTLAAFKAGQSKWEREPTQYACKAYCSARQELNILINLKHPHIVPLIGICTNPLAIVLDLAPMGALDKRLKHYQRSGDKLTARSIQQVILQIAKAIEYLHQQSIIYRDLKSENVLVWKFPEPFHDRSTRRSETPEVVVTKLADYGISRPTLPSGSKGFGGTEGFMAPEIVKYNGEEEYTEKVDCFSFGMFIYELLTLHQPFVGYDTVKELILEGGRPPLTPRELLYPNYLLDLMVVCWAHEPKDRPTASQLVSIASAPEFIRLMDVVSLNEGGACSAYQVTHPRQIRRSADVHHHYFLGSIAAEFWLACSSGFSPADQSSQLQILEIDGQGGCWQGLKYLSRGDKNKKPSACQPEKTWSAITCMCLVNEDTVWVGDNAGFIHSYLTGAGGTSSHQDDSSGTTLSSYSLLFSYKMEPEGIVDEEGAPSPVRAIHPVPDLGRVCVAMHNGRMFLCCSDVVPASTVGCEGSFVVTELGTSSCIHSVASIVTVGPLFRREMDNDGAEQQQNVATVDDEIEVEVWCGQSHGSITVYTLTGSGAVVTSQEVVNHHDPVVENVEVLQIVSASPSNLPKWQRDRQEKRNLAEKMAHLVWTFVYPGCNIYQWDARSKVICNRLDCSKLVPCSESLKTIAIDEHFSPGRCQVAAITILDEKLYIGTSWGCLIVAEAASMRPITVFRPFCDEVQAIAAVRLRTTTARPRCPPRSRPSVASKTRPHCTSGHTSSIFGKTILRDRRAKMSFMSEENKGEEDQEDDDDGQQLVEEDDDDRLLLVTLGKGYRSLIRRYVDVCGGQKYRTYSSAVNHHSAVQADDGREEDATYGDNAHTLYALLWKPDDWLTD